MDAVPPLPTPLPFLAVTGGCAGRAGDSLDCGECGGDAGEAGDMALALKRGECLVAVGGSLDLEDGVDWPSGDTPVKLSSNNASLDTLSVRPDKS